MKLTINNFGPLDDATIHIGDFTVLAGPNNTGKSFVSKFLYSLFDAMNANHALMAFEVLAQPLEMLLQLLEKIGPIAVLNHLSAKLYWLNLGNWKYFFCRMPLTNRSLICSKQVVHTAWVRTKVLPFNQMSSTGFSCGV